MDCATAVRRAAFPGRRFRAFSNGGPKRNATANIRTGAFFPVPLLACAGQGPSHSMSPKLADNRMAPKVLLVDDDPLIHRLYRPHIERAGYQVLNASSGVEAIELATRELPQLIVMDIMMPELDGLSEIGRAHV